MKKSTVRIVIFLIIVMVSGGLFISRIFIVKKNNTQKLDIHKDIENRVEKDNDISFSEFTYNISKDEVVKARYMKSGQTIKIYSVYPVESREKYDISTDGSMALYVAKNGDIWTFHNNGDQKKLTPDRYGSIVKSEVQKINPAYIWAEKPCFISDGNIRFISNLPENNDSQKSIWEINVSNNNMYKIYTPKSDLYNYLGYRDDGKLLIYDGDNIAVIDTSNSLIENINAKDKYILNMSPDGTKIIFAFKNSNGQPDFSSLFFMDSKGVKYSRLPGINNFIPTSMGVWNSLGSEYAFISKSQLDLGDRVSIISFDEANIEINSYSIEGNNKFDINCKLVWINNSSLSIDTGDNVINVELNKS